MCMQDDNNEKYQNSCVCKGVERFKVAQGTIQWQSVMDKSIEKSDETKFGRHVGRWFEYRR